MNNYPSIITESKRTIGAESDVLILIIKLVMKGLFKI